MSSEHTAPTAPATFYLQYHVEGSSGGEWNASESSDSSKFFKLDTWVIQPGGEYLLSANAKQGSGQACYVFAAFTFDGVNYWGARLPPDGAYVDAGNVTAPNKEGVQLTARAGTLISGDPQVQVGGSTLVQSEATMSITWNGKDRGGWTYSNDGTPVRDDTVTLKLYQGEASLTVIDATGESNTVALYQKDGTIYEQPKELVEPRYAAVYSITDEGTYTVNVFNDSGDAKTKG